MSTLGKVSPCKAIFKDLSGMSPSVKIWYYCCLARRKGELDEEREVVFASKEALQNMLKYAVGTELRATLYESLRRKVVRNMPKSKLVSEIAANYLAVEAIVQYIKLTVQMWWIKRRG